MSNETDIDIPSSEHDESEAFIVEPKAKKRFGLPVLLGAMFLSSAFGAGVIGAISHFNQAAAPNLAPLTAKIETIGTEAQSLAAENKTLKAQIARLQRDIKKGSASPSVDLTPLEKRVASLEETEPKPIDAELLTRLKALQDEGSQALDLTDILARLEALENRPVAAPMPATSEADFNLDRRIEFPGEAILARLEKPEGWLQKSLKKHISVQSDENPRYLVDLINTHIDAGNIEAAIAAYEKLPADAKTAGQAWRESLNR